MKLTGLEVHSASPAHIIYTKKRLRQCSWAGQIILSRDQKTRKNRTAFLSGNNKNARFSSIGPKQMIRNWVLLVHFYSCGNDVIDFISKKANTPIDPASSLIRETTENESTNYGYKFGQEEETYNIVAARLLWSFNLPIRFI
jgi:hypothetical protein